MHRGWEPVTPPCLDVPRARELVPPPCAHVPRGGKLVPLPCIRPVPLGTSYVVLRLKNPVGSGPVKVKGTQPFIAWGIVGGVEDRDPLVSHENVDAVSTSMGGGASRIVSGKDGGPRKSDTRPQRADRPEWHNPGTPAPPLPTAQSKRPCGPPRTFCTTLCSCN